MKLLLRVHTESPTCRPRQCPPHPVGLRPARPGSWVQWLVPRSHGSSDSACLAPPAGCFLPEDNTNSGDYFFNLCIYLILLLLLFIKLFLYLYHIFLLFI